MLKANIAVFVSGGGTNLQALIDAQKSGIIESGEIKVVVSSQKDAYALTRAANAGIPGVAVVKKECGSQEAYEEALMKVLREYDIYYGLKVHEEALKYGVKVSGATVHYVNEVPDGGQIIYQKAVEVQDGDTPEVLQRRIMEQAEWILLPRATEKVCADIVKERAE